MSGRVFKREGRSGFLVVGYSKMALFPHRKQAFDYAEKLDPPRGIDRALPGWVEVER